MKSSSQSPDTLLEKAYQCQADADAIGQIIVHLKMLDSELTTDFGCMDKQLLEETVHYLVASADHMRDIADHMQNIAHLFTPIGPGSNIKAIAAALKD